MRALPPLAALLLAACSFDKPSDVDDDGGGGDDAATIDAPAGDIDAFVPTCTPVQGTPALDLEPVVSGLDMPVFVGSPPGDPRLFILEKAGEIRIVEDGLLLPAPFATLDVANVTSLNDERGLLGLAFAPDYATSRKLYVFYMDNASDHQVDQYLADATNPNLIDTTSRQPVFTLDDFAGNHNGGMMAFGPDGMLYIGIGDGGSGDDPNDYGENVSVTFGKILRIDVSSLPYAIPSGNPYAGGGGAPEVWHYGLRNPWRWSFDRMTGDMYIGDVGQNQWEEVDVVAAGTSNVNFGWDTREAAHCHEPTTGCPTTGRTDPVYEYGHAEGCTVVGGYVYRGCRMPGYHGTYFFGEYCGGWIRSFQWNGSTGFSNEVEHAGLAIDDIVSFGEDAAGELYVVVQDSANGGAVHRIVPQ
jgi:glucose/arabinose dehydrogenase